jgi:hypothetical protein
MNKFCIILIRSRATLSLGGPGLGFLPKKKKNHKKIRKKISFIPNFFFFSFGRFISFNYLFIFSIWRFQISDSSSVPNISKIFFIKV